MQDEADTVTLPGERVQFVLDLGHEEARSEADFMVCEANSLAFEHCAVAEWSSPLTLLEGPAKSGKSHLARIWMKRVDAVFAAPGALKSLAAHGGQRPVLIEDVDRLDYDERDLFHLLNQSMRDERPVLMTARASIAEWPFVTEDVRSRARLASWFPLTAPSDILLSQMMVKLFADRQLLVDPKVVSYLVARMERSSEEAVAIVALADKLALSRGRAITRAIAAEVLELRTRRSADNSIAEG